MFCALVWIVNIWDEKRVLEYQELILHWRGGGCSGLENLGLSLQGKRCKWVSGSRRSNVGVVSIVQKIGYNRGWARAFQGMEFRDLLVVAIEKSSESDWGCGCSKWFVKNGWIFGYSVQWMKNYAQEGNKLVAFAKKLPKIIEYWYFHVIVLGRQKCAV